MTPLIVCIVGASGSGKTTASMILQERFNWNAIVSYTTRPMRDGEVNGKEHWFVTPDLIAPKSSMCAYTQFGGYEYWTEWNQFFMFKTSVYVIDEKGLLDLCNKDDVPFDFTLTTIKIKRNDLSGIDKKRKARDEERVFIPDEQYDYVINNNGSIKEFSAALESVAQCIMQKRQNNGSTERRKTNTNSVHA